MKEQTDFIKLITSLNDDIKSLRGTLNEGQTPRFDSVCNRFNTIISVYDDLLKDVVKGAVSVADKMPDDSHELPGKNNSQH